MVTQAEALGPAYVELPGSHDEAPALLRDPSRRVTLSPRATFSTMPHLDESSSR